MVVWSDEGSSNFKDTFLTNTNNLLLEEFIQGPGLSTNGHIARFQAVIQTHQTALTHRSCLWGEAAH